MAQTAKGAGDPEGKRIARRTATTMEEACRVAESLAMLMRRCKVNETPALDIAKDLRLEAVTLREKAEGRIQSRLTTKNTGHPLLENRKVNCLYLDESGTSVLSARDRVFALGGVAIDEENVAAYKSAADEIKRRFFGSDHGTFHEPNMRKRDGIFWFGGDTGRQSQFDAVLRDLIQATPFTAFGVSIRKDEFKSEFIDPATDPYLPTKVYELAIMLIMERYVDMLATSPERRLGRVHLESIGAREDAEHQLAYSELMLYGTQFVPEPTFQSWVEAGCRFSPKQGSNPAELADMVAREVFEWTRDGCSVDPPYWDILSPKIHLRADGHFGKFGLKVFPSGDLEDLVMAHRRRCGATPRN